MQNKDMPFALEIPAQLGNVKLTIFISEYCYARGAVNSAVKPHNHDNYELQYIVSGCGSQLIEGKRQALSAGDIVILHPKEYHNRYADALSTDFSQFSFRFSVKPMSTQPTEEQRRGYGEMLDILESVHILRDNEFTLLPTLNSITEEICERPYGYFYCLQSLCVVMVTKLLRLCDRAGKDIFPANELRYGGRLRILIDRFFQDRYMNDVKLIDLANTINISERHASRHIKRIFGMNFSAKLLEYRVEQSKLQLLHTDKEISRIAADCGFQSSTYFSSSFRKATGLTPSQYRAHNLHPEG